jgi:hypothetical protein
VFRKDVEKYSNIKRAKSFKDVARFKCEKENNKSKCNHKINKPSCPLGIIWRWLVIFMPWYPLDVRLNVLQNKLGSYGDDDFPPAGNLTLTPRLSSL